METEKNNAIFGLLGKNISYSFSKTYFTQKFERLGLKNHQYQNFDLPEITALPGLLKLYKKQLKGFNITTPYKVAVFDFLDEIDAVAKEVGAINTVKIMTDGRMKGYNTDVYGFEMSLKPFLKSFHKKALILGTGGASKAIAYVLKKHQIAVTFVSRNPSNTLELSYAEINQKVLEEHLLIINCTPVGTHPNTAVCPALPYAAITKKHVLFDLIYNPPESRFLAKGKQQSATVKNGLEMLELQAEKSWEIWDL